MGQVLMFDRTNTWTAQHALAKASASPGVVYWIDHTVCDNGVTSLLRHCIKAVSAEQLKVTRYKVFAQDVNKEVFTTDLGVFFHQFEAKNCIEHHVTLMELEGAEFREEQSYELVEHLRNLQLDEATAHFSHLGPLTVRDTSEVVPSGLCFIQPLTKGVRCLVVIDCFERYWVSPASGKILWEDASNVIKSALQAFISVPEGRGLVAEIVVDGTNVSIMDVLFLHNTWLIEKNRHERVKLADEYMKANKLPGKLFHVIRMNISAIDSLIGGDVVAASVEVGRVRYVVSRVLSSLHFSSGYEGAYHVQDDFTFEKHGVYQGSHLPNMSFRTLQSAGTGLHSFIF